MNTITKEYNRCVCEFATSIEFIIRSSRDVSHIVALRTHERATNHRTQTH